MYFAESKKNAINILNSFHIVLKAMEIKSVNPITTKVRLGIQHHRTRNNQNSQVDSQGGLVQIRI